MESIKSDTERVPRYAGSERSPVTMFAYEAGVELRWVKNAPLGVAEDVFMALLEQSHIEGVSARSFADAVRGVSRTKDPFYGICSVMIGGVARRFEVSLNPHINDRILGVANDLGRAETEGRAVRSLSLELAHRTKNLMAVISSLATQTGRRFETFGEFKKRFSSQIGALSHAHDAIASTGWDGAVLERIVRTQLETDRPDADVSIGGNALGVMLTPNAAQNIAIVLNDLAGACTVGATVSLTADLLDERRLQMLWTVSQPVCKDDLWLDLLVKVAPMTLDGTGEISENGDTFTYALTCTSDHFARV